jgi:hypothetical protein
MRSSDRHPIRRESNPLRVESLEDRHLLSITPFTTEIPRANPITVADTSIILVSEPEIAPQVRPSEFAVVSGETTAGRPDLSAFIVEAGVRSAGNGSGSDFLLTQTAVGGVTPFVMGSTASLSEAVGFPPGGHITLGSGLFSEASGRISGRPTITELSGESSVHLTASSVFWANFDPASFDQFLRSSQPSKTASVLLVSAIADADPQTAPSPAASNAGKEDARIIRALRDSESEVAPVVANADGANSIRLLSGQFRIRPSVLSAEAGSTLVDQSDSPGNPSATASEDGSWSRDSQRGTDEDATAETPVPAVEIELLASFNPFNRASIERAIDDLLGGLGELEAALPDLGEARDLLTHALGTAAALTVVEIVRRKIRGDSDGSEEGMDSGSPGVPCFPNRWTVDEI